MAPRSKSIDRIKEKQKGLEVFSESAIRNNFSALEYSRTCQAAASGMAAGILGLTSIPGFIFYFVTVAIQMSVKDLQKKLEEQHKQILLYEKKLKGANKLLDVVRAYKSLETEKNALQSVIGSLDAHNEEMIVGAEEKTLTESEDSAVSKLRQAIAILTKEKVKREAAFQNDKKALLEENEGLKEQLRKTVDENEQQADKFCKIIQELSQKVKRIEGDRERELDDHGSVLAEMQQRYAKEKQTVEAAQKQFDHARDIEEALFRGKQTTVVDKQSLARIAELEATTQDLTERVAISERKRYESNDELKKHDKRTRNLRRFQIAELDSELSLKSVADDVIDRFKSALTELREFHPDIDVHKIVGPDPATINLQEKLENIEEKYEKYKQNTESVLNTKKQVLSTELVQEDGLRELVCQLHNKLRNIEVSQSTDQAQYEMTTRNLRERILELERSEIASRNEMRKEMQLRVSEMEFEMQKQRNRTLEVLAEKEKELEVTKSILVSLRSEQLNSAPADPSQAGKISSQRKSSDHRKCVDRRISSGSRRSIDGISVSSTDIIGSADNNISFPNVSETRNVFYEDELAKKDKEVQEMRNALHHLDYRMREIEQNALCKDLQHHEMNEKLKEEIRILEEGHLSSLGIPTTYLLPLVNETPVIVDYVNHQYLVFSESDASRLRSKLRMVVEGMTLTVIENCEKRSSPYCLMNEQVAVLAQYGLAQVRKMHDGPRTVDTKIFEASTSTANKELCLENDVKKARQIATGRKAKELKRKANGQGANAKALKVRKCDLNGIEVTDDDVNNVLLELKGSVVEHDPRVNLPKYSNEEHLYSSIDYLSLPLPSSREFRTKEIVFHDLWRRGFYITCGSRFGCHYLAYEDNPSQTHAKFFVECILSDECLSPMKLITLTRVATQVKKTVLLAVVSSDNNIPHYMEIQWWKPY
uniref:tRNA-intron lyase n=1 Tax=Heterorhabditis bacteriophora TaxID=37862 RepID=A0A1I7XUX6_HETBA